MPRRVDSQIEGAPWDFAYNFTFPGADAIHVDVPFVWVERCTVRGADAVADDNSPHTESVDAGDAIVSTGTVVLLDSSVRGGDGPSASWDAGGAGGCPAVCPGGAGGDGVVAGQLIRANSTIVAGAGMRWLDEVGVLTCCDGPQGTALVVSVETALAHDVFASGPACPGQPWTLTWNLTGPAALLFASAGVGPAGQFGTRKLQLLPPLFLGVALPASGRLSVTVPLNTALTGVEFGAQLYSVAGWSRPVAGVLAP